MGAIGTRGPLGHHPLQDIPILEIPVTSSDTGQAASLSYFVQFYQLSAVTAELWVSTYFQYIFVNNKLSIVNHLTVVSIRDNVICSHHYIATCMWNCLDKHDLS